MAGAHGFDDDEKRKLHVLYRATGIHRRHSVIQDYASVDPKSWTFYPQTKNLAPFPSTKARVGMYKKEALPLSLAAIKDCFFNTRVAPGEITHLVTVSCTGMYAPGLDIDLINELNLSKNVQRTAINFMGCYAAITGLKMANTIAAADPKAKVLLVSVELCTLHFQNKTDEDNLLANALFSDGAAAAIITKTPNENENFHLEMTGFHCNILTQGKQEMAWNIGDFGFEMQLSSYVPNLIKTGIHELVSELTRSIDHQMPEHFAIHPGGKKILDVIESELGIHREKNSHAHEALREHGNMSSATILFVLRKLWSSLEERNRGENVLSLAFGPGLTLESMLLRVS